MLVCATLFWAGNFTIGKFAFLENIPPFSLAFLRWSLVWIILFPFTYREIFKLKHKIKKNLSSFFILGFTSVCIFTSFTYNALNYTQVINASLFNTAIPVTIILVCFLLKIEKTKTQYLALGDSYTIGESVDEKYSWPIQLKFNLLNSDSNIVQIEVLHIEFLGSFCRVKLGGGDLKDVSLRADFSISLTRLLSIKVGLKLKVSLPSKLIRIYLTD